MLIIQYCTTELAQPFLNRAVIVYCVYCILNVAACFWEGKEASSGDLPSPGDVFGL